MLEAADAFVSRGAHQGGAAVRDAAVRRLPVVTKAIGRGAPYRVVHIPLAQVLLVKGRPRLLEVGLALSAQARRHLRLARPLLRLELFHVDRLSGGLGIDAATQQVSDTLSVCIET